MDKVTCRAHGREFSLLDTGGKQIDLMRQGTVYEPALLEWVYEQGLTGLALDVGANIGNHALWFSEICQLRVVAFEPVEHEILTSNVRLNEADARVMVWKMALGDEPGHAAETSKCTLTPGSGPIPVETLDRVAEFIGGPISLVKIDVEGMEAAVVRGGLETLAEHKPIVLTEEWEPSTTEELTALLTPLGYKRTGKFGGRGRAPMGRWQA